MTGELAAAGDLATGGLLGRAVEPRAGEHATGAHGDGICLNCGHALIGDFCHVCGQTSHVHTTLSSIGHDLLHGVFHFDGKIWNTLPLLFSRPGELTRRYIAGERARFVSPLALFLFSVFLMVATFESVGGPFGQAVHTTRNGKEMSLDNIKAEIARQQQRRDRLKEERTVLRAQHGNTAKLDEAITDIEGDLAGLETARSFTEGKLIVADDSRVNVNTGIPALNDRIRAALKHPDLFLYKLQSSAYKFSWLLVPISLPFIWLLFAFRRDVGPYDHAIFAIYSLSAMTLGVVGLSILKAVGLSTGLVALVLIAGPPLHMYKQLRGAYRIGRLSALWRTAALLVSATIAGTLFFIGVIGLAA